jgi:hypothetical protein
LQRKRNHREQGSHDVRSLSRALAATSLKQT